MKHEAFLVKYFRAWQHRDWNFVGEYLAKDFTFTTQYDDHINLTEYRQKCWDTVTEIETYTFQSFMEKDNEAFVRYQGKINGEKVQNVEHFHFEDGKIKSVHVFFGRPE